MGHLHDLEHRLSSPRLGNKLEDVDQGFRGEVGCEIEFVPNDDDAPDDVFEGGMKFLQLLRVSASCGALGPGADLHCRGSSENPVSCIHVQTNVYQNAR